jgi:Isochorismatase family
LPLGLKYMTDITPQMMSGK